MQRLARTILVAGLTLAASGCAEGYYDGYYGSGYGYAPGYVPYSGIYGYTAPSYGYVQPRRYYRPPPPPPAASARPRWTPPPASAPRPPPAPPPVASAPRPPPPRVDTRVPTVGPGTYARRYLNQRGPVPEVGAGN